MNQIGNLARICAARENTARSVSGQIRQVTTANTQGFYSIVASEPEHKSSKANGGKGSALWWGKASRWEFKEGSCSFYDSDKDYSSNHLVLTMQMLSLKTA